MVLRRVVMAGGRAAGAWARIVSTLRRFLRWNARRAGRAVTGYVRQRWKSTCRARHRVA